MNKLDRHFLYRVRFYHLFIPLRNHVTSLLSNQSLRECKDGRVSWTSSVWQTLHYIELTLPVGDPRCFGSIVRNTSPKHLLSSSGGDHFTKDWKKKRKEKRKVHLTSFILRRRINGFHVTSPPPCWWTVNKRSLISSLYLSTSICSFHHCYLCLPRLHENHL